MLMPRCQRRFCGNEAKSCLFVCLSVYRSIYLCWVKRGMCFLIFGSHQLGTAGEHTGFLQPNNNQDIMFGRFHEANSGTKVCLALACWTPTSKGTTRRCNTNCNSRTLTANFPTVRFHFNLIQGHQFMSIRTFCLIRMALSGHCMLHQPNIWVLPESGANVGVEYPLAGASQTDLFLNSDLYVYTECNNAGKQLRPPNTLCWPSAEGHPGKLSEQTQLISGRCLWINRISWLLTGCDFIFCGGGGGGRILDRCKSLKSTNDSGVRIKSPKPPTGFGLVTYFNCDDLMCSKSLLFIMCNLCFHHYWAEPISLFIPQTDEKRTFLFFQVAPWFSLRHATLEMLQQFKRGKLCLFALVPNPPQPDGEPWQIRDASSVFTRFYQLNPPVFFCNQTYC